MSAGSPKKDAEPENWPLTPAGYDALLATVADVVAIVDEHGIRRYVSGSIEGLLGYKPVEVVGTLIKDVVDPAQHDALAELLAAVNDQPERSHTRDLRVRHADGSWRWVEAIAENRLSDPNVLGIVVTSRDITDRKLAETTLLAREERLRLGLEAGRLATWDWMPANGMTAWSEGMAEMYGAPSHTREICVKDWLALIHPDDRERIRAADEIATATGQDYTAEFRVLWTDGSIHWLSEKGRVVDWTPDGKPSRMTGVTADVTARKEAEAALRASDDRFRALVQHSADIIALLDTSGRFLYASPALEQILGSSPSADEYLLDLGHIHTDDHAVVKGAWEGALIDDGHSERCEFRIRHVDGSWNWIDATFTGLTNDPAVNGVVINARDITERRAQERAVQESEQRLRLAIGAGQLVVWDWDLATDVISLSNARAIDGYDTPSWTYQEYVNNLFEQDRNRVIANDRRLIATGESEPIEYRAYDVDGSLIWLYEQGTRICDEHGRPERIVGVTMNISARKAAEDALRLRDRAINAVSNGIVIVDATDPERPIIDVNAGFELLTGYSRQESLGRNSNFLEFEGTSNEKMDDLRRAIQQGLDSRVQLLSRRKDGTSFWNEVTLSAVRDPHGRLSHIVGVLSDITERKSMEARLLHLAYHDTLTGLANRACFLEGLEKAIAVARTGSAHGAVLFLDLDRFKVINDSLGHTTGDQLLIQVAKRLLASLRPHDMLARFGGDEFAVLLTNVDSEDATTAVGNRLIGSMQTPFVLDGREAYLGVSAGVAMIDEHSGDADDLLRQADVALYEAKAKGRGGWSVFNGELGARATKRLDLETELRHGLNRGEFELHYQPFVDLASGYIHGFEALVRWRHPTKGPISPAEFIPLAEETGLIVPLGEWVLSEACRQATSWDVLRPDDPPAIAVNVSPRQFQGPSLANHLWRSLSQSGMAPQRLKLEVTEQALIEDAESTVALLTSVKSLGVRLALDDFGTGYSSLGRLHALPLDVLKIDRSFISAIERDSNSAAIVRAVATLGRDLGLSITAEGIETEGQRRAALDLGCDIGQGFLFSKPIPAMAASALMRSSLVLANATPLRIGSA